MREIAVRMKPFRLAELAEAVRRTLSAAPDPAADVVELRPRR